MRHWQLQEAQAFHGTAQMLSQYWHRLKQWWKGERVIYVIPSFEVPSTRTVTATADHRFADYGILEAEEIE
jgi:hypothetical protein